MFDWYRLFNLPEFEDLGIPSITFTVELEGIGLREVQVTKGNLTGVMFDDHFLPINLNDKNPFRFGERAVLLDQNDDVWIGVYRAD